MDSVNQILEQALSDIAGCDDLRALDELRVRYMGKKGEITALLKSLGGMEPEERKSFGQAVNRAKGDIASAINARKAKQEARMAAIEAGEITVEDPREKRERLLKEEERKKRAEANAKRK